jgi:putative ABC transport system permease protein
MRYLWPIERLLRHLNQTMGFKPPSTLVIGAFFAVVLLVIGLSILIFPKYSGFIFKSLRRNFLRTTLASLAIMVLAFVVTLVWSILIPLDAAMTEQTKDFKAIVSERWQVPSQMPYAYASTLEEGGYTQPGDIRIKPEDSMTWSFYGGTTDPEHLSFENIIFFFAMEPRKLPTMMDELENIDPKMIERLEKQSEGCIIGRDRLKKLNKKVGERLKVTSLNYRGIDLEFEVIGMFPDNPRYNQSAVMNRDYLQRALDQYQQKNGKKHPLAEKNLNLVWLRVPDSDTFSKLGNQVMASPLYSSPAVKCETASAGISSFLEPYKDILWGVKWVLVPALLIIMCLVMAMAISINVRERRTEMAVLKVLGFTPSRILAIVLGEALVVGVLSGLISAALAYGLVHGVMGGIPFQIAFFAVWDILPDALWWGILFGAVTSSLGSIVPACIASSVKVSEVFAKVA